MRSHWNFFAAALLVMLAIMLISQAALASSVMPADSIQQSTPARTQPATYGIGWGALMLINAGLAQGKNRSGLNWFLISLLLGPLATLLLVAFFPKLPEKTA